MEDLDLMMKVIVVGDGRIGKTCLITRFVKNVFLDEYKKTLGVDFLQKKHFIKELGEDVEFYIWDTAGQEEYNSLTRRYYKGASACILAFSIIDRDSFEHVEKWRDAVEDECGGIPMILVQTKIDLIDQAKMTTKETEALAKKLQLPLFRICSKEGTMITELFEYLAVKFFSKNLHKQEGHAPIQSVQDIKQQQSMSTSLASWNNNISNGAGATGPNKSLTGQQRSQSQQPQNKNIKLTAAFKKDAVEQNNKRRWMTEQSSMFQEPMTEDFDNLQLETYPLNLLFFLKKADDEEIMESLNKCVRYILEKQLHNKVRLVYKIFVEDWVIVQLPPAFYQQQYTRFEQWPTSEVIAKLDDKNDQYNIDYVITIGGDGTILTLLKNLQDYERHRILPPIITFSQATVVKNSAYDKISIDSRMRLHLQLNKSSQNQESNGSTNNGSQEVKVSDQQSFEFQSLNEITIMRNNENMAQVEIFINDVLLTIVQGDGMLIATPTGSTAYNLSCGGSIVHYSAQVMCVTPVAPHSLSFRPIILPANVEIKIIVPPGARTSTKVTIDGHTKLDFNQDDQIIIKKSPFNLQDGVKKTKIIYGAPDSTNNSNGTNKLSKLQMSSDAQYTSSGREVKKLGKKNLSGALAQLRAAREGGDKRTDQYQVEEAKKIFDVVDDEEYERLQNERQNDDFIVDDDGFGYRDHGGEIWEVGDDQEDGGKKKKKRKLDANEQEITNFMMPMSTINKKKGNTGSGLTIKQKPKVSEEQSKDIMNNLFNQLDNKEADELEEINSSAILAEMNKPIAFNKEEQLLNKYNVTLDHNQTKRVESVPSSISNQVGQTHQNENPFSKKRRFEEISNSATTEKQQENKRLSEQLPSHQTSYFDAKSHDESSNNDYQSAFDDSKMLDQPLEMIQNQTEKLISDAKPLGANAQQDDWAKIKQQNLQQNQEVQKIDQAATLNQYDYPLPLNPDGSLSFFWIDAHEENNGQDIYIFGKIYQPEVKQFVSCALKINGMQREIYALPKIKGKARSALSKEEEDKQVMNIFHELDDIRKKRFQQITKWKCKPVSRKYAFEMPIQHGDHKFLKIKYDCNMPSLPQGLTGTSFECLFGANQSMLELFILKRKIKGPCWFTIKNAQKVADFKKTWCRQEIFVNDPKHIEVTIDDLNRSETPPLSAVCFSFKTSRSQHNTNEIAMISCIIHNNISQDGPTPMEKFQSLTLLRKLDGRPMPHDFEYKLKSKKDIQYFSNERQMIEAFINRVTMVDPDLLVAHNLCGGMFELLLARIQFLKINHWSRIGRMKKSNIPNKKFDTGGGSYGGSHWIPRQVTCGRLLVDTFLTSKELIRETNYDLSHLAKVQLKATRTDFDEDLLPQFYISAERLFTLTDHTEKDAYLTLQLMFHLSVIPLTKQLTNIAGNLWFRSLQNARAERNEMLLLHEFKKKKFILPDKKQLTAKELKRGLFGGDEFEEPDQNAKKGGKRKKAQYSGGLVIEPKAGFYDNIILLLDFNSLYPSIIQEYNLCFTTVNRRPSKNFNGTDFKNEFKGEGEEDNEELEVELPDKNVNIKDAVLPNVLRDLVQKRKAVKEKMKNEKDQVKLQQLEIRQKAIKLTANSMYGCLGFQSSRFHAKAIAALITRTGRETLLKTKDIAENKLGFNVVYGDTDSIMINTGSNQLQQALEMGKKLKQEVNCLYKCLEIEIDGVFKSLLLLKKKKYAALKYEGWLTPDVKIVQEMKGLDMVRRDWCQLSKNVGNYVLGQILSGKSREEVVLNLNEYLSDIGEKMKSGRINLSEYIITKQLTRALSEYSEIKGQPHVAIASRLKSQGKSESELVNNFIPYVICKNPYDPEKKSPQLADKAFHPDEAIAFKGKNEIDIDWYTTQQILPPITRLIEHIDGIDVEFVAQCLGVDPKKYKYHSEKKNNEIGGADDIGPVQNPILHTETEKSLKNRSIAELKVKCPYCQHFYDFPGIYQEGKEISGLVCVKCNKQIPDQYVMNRVNLFLKQLIMLYYSGAYECQEPACNQKTRQLLINNKCITQSCKGKMIAEYSETQTNDTLRYLQGLFNVRKYLHENKQVKKPNEVPNWQSYATFQSKVDSLMDRSKYNKVDLGNIFSFMGKA